MQIECAYHLYEFIIQLKITLEKVENFEFDKVLVSCLGSMHSRKHMKASTLRVYFKIYNTKKSPEKSNTIKKHSLKLHRKLSFFKMILTSK